MTIDRRAVLAAAAGVATAQVTGSAKGVEAATPDPQSRASPSGGFIDVHHHMWPPTYMKTFHDQIDAAFGQPFSSDWTPQQSIDELDRNGGRGAVLSLASPGVGFNTREQARQAARMSNDYGAEVVRQHPGRFGFFATLPWLSVEDSLAEIAYAYDVLAADGVGMLTSYQNTYPGDVRLMPIWEELNRRNAKVYFHPNWPGCCRNLVPDVIDSTIEFPFDTTRAIVSLVVGGVVTKFPNVRLIFAHGGGTLPMLAGRISWFLDRRPQTSSRFPNGSMAELRKLYFDTALATTAPAWAGLTALAHPDHVLLGTDFPMAGPIAPWRQELKALGLPADRVSAIEWENAERLFPRFTET